MNIVILGHVCIDRNTSENASYTAAGGPAMFMSKIFRELPECQTTIIAPYGKDFVPFANGVNLYPSQPTVEYTLVYENITKEKKRVQKCFNYQTATPVNLTDKMISMIESVDVLYIAPLVPNFSPEYLKSVMQYVQTDCLKILLPQGYFRDFEDHIVKFREFTEAGTILPMVDAAVVSDQDYPEMFGVAKKWAGQNDITVLVTTGENGAEVFTKDQQFSVPTQPVAEKDIVDSVGSGDIFSAGFGYWYKKTGDLKQSIEFANKLARQCLFYRADEIKVDYKFLITNS